MVTSLSAGDIHRIMLENHVSEWYLPCQLTISTGSCSKIMSANGTFPVSWRYPPVHAPKSCQRMVTSTVSWLCPPVHAPKSCQRMVTSLSAGDINRFMLQNHVSEGNFPVSWRYPPVMLQNHVSEWYLPCQLAMSTGSCYKIM